MLETTQQPTSWGMHAPPHCCRYSVIIAKQFFFTLWKVETSRAVHILFALLTPVLGGVLTSGLDGANVDVDEHQRVPRVRTPRTPEARGANHEVQRHSGQQVISSNTPTKETC